MEYDVRPLLRILQIMQMPAMVNIPDHDCRVIDNFDYDKKICQMSHLIHHPLTYLIQNILLRSCRFTVLMKLFYPQSQSPSLYPVLHSILS